jgi:hypothetical protein
MQRIFLGLRTPEQALFTLAKALMSGGREGRAKEGLLT